ncbi:hypothetical protein BJ085DRAFT_37995 [Dimargaris cristalligena]|uniref:Uncharacterized protein n=1 Tax=Dimargaris cristalligena TaxID=215637 RepID=A0A4V1J5I1_9FUNG|nr:hypothetical protein BJ085DRAFT_37995 [Dimargaris cristalligena]|eukprot:RKP39139.1 hypothetical protein BJ085DRAFT_37995 [Dimargaris cristalligena]
MAVGLARDQTPKRERNQKRFDIVSGHFETMRFEGTNLGPFSSDNSPPLAIPFLELMRKDMGGHALGSIMEFLRDVANVKNGLTGLVGDYLDPNSRSLYHDLIAITLADTSPKNPANSNSGSDSFAPSEIGPVDLSILIHMYRWMGLALASGNHYAKLCRLLKYVDPLQSEPSKADRGEPYKIGMGKLILDLAAALEPHSFNTAVYLRYECGLEAWAARYTALGDKDQKLLAIDNDGQLPTISDEPVYIEGRDFTVKAQKCSGYAGLFQSIAD